MELGLGWGFALRFGAGQVLLELPPYKSGQTAIGAIIGLYEYSIRK